MKGKTLALYIEADPAAPEFLRELEKRATQCVAANLAFDYRTGGNYTDMSELSCLG